VLDSKLVCGFDSCFSVVYNMKYDFKIMDNKLFLCCITLFVMMLFNFVKSSSHLLKLLACVYVCLLVLMVLWNHGGVSRMLCYAMLCYAMLWTSQAMICYAIVNRY